MKKPAPHKVLSHRVVATHAKPAKHAKAKKTANPSVEQQIKKLQGEITTLKHDITKKKTKAHKGTKHAKAKSRSWSPGWDVGCCVAEALAASLRLQGLPVGDEQMLSLFWAAGGDVDDGLVIEAALAAAARYGLAGGRLASARECPVDDPALPPGQLLRHVAEPDLGEVDHRFGEGLVHALILGLDLPQAPHVVVATAKGWWSWGELYDPASFVAAGAVVEEAWAVTWA